MSLIYLNDEDNIRWLMYIPKGEVLLSLAFCTIISDYRTASDTWDARFIIKYYKANISAGGWWVGHSLCVQHNAENLGYPVHPY